jgi:pimeloyl-ACP methyl ester carboxylesterase
MKLPAIAILGVLSAGAQPFQDRTHPSKVFGENRNYRILLPPGYETGGKRYPVIYYHHGHSDRYTVERYDEGRETIPKMAEFVARNDVIVVCVDGYVARDYTGFYGGSPWDVRKEGGDFDFGEYFRELVAHIDSTYPTLASRRYRATSGLSMGGFMSLWLSARYPDLIGSASSFNPGPEFYTGDKDRRVLWRPKDHVAAHSLTMVRLIRASGDYISQYHEETRDAYARSEVDFEYRQDEYHRHWATSIGETFAFHMRAFATPHLDNVPESFSHSNPYRAFEVWGYRVEAAGAGPAIVYLDRVTQGGLRITTRRWAPDGPPNAGRHISVITRPLYGAGKTYTLIDHNLVTGATARRDLIADAQGRLSFAVDGAGHQISFAGPGTGAQPPVMLPLTASDRLRPRPDREITLPIRVYNPRAEAMKDVRAALTTDYPTVKIQAGSASFAEIGSGAIAEFAARVRMISGAGDFAPARLRLRLTYDGYFTSTENIDVHVVPSVLEKPSAVEILDGRTVTLPVFRQAGNQGGGAIIERTVTEGKGNGNGVLEPGEEATVWVKLAQGMDPFDRNTWRRAKVYPESPFVAEIADIEESKQREWTSAQERTSVIRLDPKTPPGATPLLLSAESWSFYYTPDVRYGREPLYQAFQLHTRHVLAWELPAR